MTTMIDTTEGKLADMLTENTGRHFLDSGGAYGRNWERNQGEDFDSQPEGNVEFWQRDGELDILPTLSVYHFLKDRLEYNPELDERYREYVGEDGYLDIQTAESFALSIDGKGIYGDDSGPLTVNTYNGEDLLSQVIQYVYWTDDDGAHVLLQIHGGCDVRGGYTYPVAFDVADYDGTGIFDNARASIYCECGKHWDSDGSYWAPDGCHDQTYLEDYPATDERPDYPAPDDPNQLELFTDERKAPDVGAIWVDDDRNGHCPHCGGILNLAPWPC